MQSVNVCYCSYKTYFHLILHPESQPDSLPFSLPSLISQPPENRIVWHISLFYWYIRCFLETIKCPHIQLMFVLTWEAWISHQFSMLAGRDGEGSASGLSDSHNMVRQSPGGQQEGEVDIYIFGVKLLFYCEKFQCWQRWQRQEHGSQENHSKTKQLTFISSSVATRQCQAYTCLSEASRHPPCSYWGRSL